MNIPADLAAAIHGAPDDPAGYLVLGDWLEELGIPHGELIALMCADREDARIAELQHVLDPLRERGGRVDWQWGAARRAEVGRSCPPDALLALLRAPTGGFLRELVIPELGNDAQPWLDLLIVLASTDLPVLRGIRFGSYGAPPLVLDAFWRAFARLERVALDAPVELRPFAAPALRELRIQLADDAQARALAASELPALEHLHVVYPGAIADPFGWLARAHLPRLRWLTATTRELALHAELLAGAPIARPLEVADVVRYDDHARLDADDRIFAFDHRPRGGEAGLLVLAGPVPLPGTLWPLPARGRFTLGRLRTSDLLLGGGTAGRRHGYVERRGDRWLLLDLIHSSPTEINGRAMTECELRCDDEITIGHHALLFLEGDLAALAADRRRRHGVAAIPR